MRLFLSIDFPCEVNKYLKTIQDIFKHEKLFEGNYSNAHMLHLTVLFIGEVSQKDVPIIQEALNCIIVKQFELCLGSLGVFQKKEYPALLWIDAQGDFLHELVCEIRTLLAPLVKLEVRDFVSHITLARIKKVYDMQKFFAFIEDFKVERHCFLVEGFNLKESVMVNEGHKHRIIARYSLQKI